MVDQALVGQEDGHGDRLDREAEGDRSAAPSPRASLSRPRRREERRARRHLPGVGRRRGAPVVASPRRAMRRHGRSARPDAACAATAGWIADQPVDASATASTKSVVRERAHGPSPHATRWPDWRKPRAATHLEAHAAAIADRPTKRIPPRLAGHDSERLSALVAPMASGNAAATGLVAEWLRSGLQIRAPRFDSGRGLHPVRSARLCFSGDETD